MYDAFTGKVKKVLGELQEERMPGELTSFCMGPRLRKFFIGDNSGLLRLYNIKSGEFMGAVVRPEEVRDRAGTTDRKLFRKSYEVSQVIFVEDQNMLITASCDSVVRVYEAKPNEDPKLLRELRGGHREADITHAEYCRECLSLFTGAVNGTAAVWNFETSRLAGVLHDEETDLTAMKHVHPFPCLFTGSSRGVICCWKTRDFRKSPPLLFKINIFDQFSNINVRPVNALLSLEVPFPVLDLSGFERPVFAQSQNYLRDAGYRQSNGKRHFVRPFEEVRKMMVPVFNGTAAFPDEANSKVHLVVGIGSGEVQVYNVGVFMKAHGVEALPSSEYNLKRAERFKISLMRKDNVNGDKASEGLMEEVAGLFPSEKAAFYLDTSVFSRSWKAHKDGICSLDKVSEHTEGFVSSGKDKFIRVWSPRGEKWGEFNIIHMSQPFWRFPYDWVRIIVKELDEVFDLIEKLDKIELTSKQRGVLQARYLYNNYVLPDLRASKLMLREAGEGQGGSKASSAGQTVMEKLQFFNNISKE